MTVTFIGVRHHSPACARLVAATIDALRPAYVLIEGPADLNERIGELLLGHELPVAVFSSYRDGERRHGSWAPFCAYSPEWVALTHGRAVGAELKFIDLPAWHPAFAGLSNRYADAELRYAEVMERLCRSFDVDNVDVLWDHLFEIAPDEDLAERLALYFDLVRGESPAGESDTAREAYMAQWVRAAATAAGERPVVVVTGGFHRPALVSALATAPVAVRPAATDGTGPTPADAPHPASSAVSEPTAGVGVGVGPSVARDAVSGPAGVVAGVGPGVAGGAVSGPARVVAGVGPGVAGGAVSGPAGVGAGPAGDTGSHSAGDAGTDPAAGAGSRLAKAAAGHPAGAGAAAAGYPIAADGWPEVPSLPPDAIGGSFLVPYSFRRLDAFDGYQSGMPSPGYYQELWEAGPRDAARRLTESVAGRLRERKQPVSTADLIAARATAEGLATVRGHRHPSRTDVLDGLASALVKEALDVPLPWAARGTLRTGSHPVVVEMVAALSGTRVGRLHPDTPAPPLVHHANAELERLGLDVPTDLDLDLTVAADRSRSQVLHRVRILTVPGFRRDSGPTTGLDPVLRERWTLRPDPARLTAFIEAGAYGATLDDACNAALAERAAQAGRDVDLLAGVLFDAALSGTTEVSEQALSDIEATVAGAADLGALGRMLAVVLTMWRHDRILGTAHSATLGVVIAASVRRVMWLAEGVHGWSAAADLGRIGALAACRDALRYTRSALDLDLTAALEVAARISADGEAPPDLRGAAFGLRWALRQPDETAGRLGPERVVRGGLQQPDETAGRLDPERAVRGAFRPGSAGDWLAGLFALAREEVLHTTAVIGLLDELLSGMAADDFLIAVPALRQAFEFFPPREREIIAGRLLERRGLGGTGRDLLRGVVEPELVAAGMLLDDRVDTVLRRAGLMGGARD